MTMHIGIFIMGMLFGAFAGVIVMCLFQLNCPSAGTAIGLLGCLYCKVVRHITIDPDFLDTLQRYLQQNAEYVACVNNPAVCD